VLLGLEPHKPYKGKTTELRELALEEAPGSYAAVMSSKTLRNVTSLVIPALKALREAQQQQQ
jgi:hypothetical protein